MALKNPFSSRQLVASGGYSLQLTLPKERLREEGLGHDDEVPVTHQEGSLEIRLDAGIESFDEDSRLRLVPVGGSIGITVPAGIRDRYGLEGGESVFVDASGRRISVELE